MSQQQTVEVFKKYFEEESIGNLDVDKVIKIFSDLTIKRNCRATTSKNVSCRNKAVVGTEYCPRHGPSPPTRQKLTDSQCEYIITRGTKKNTCCGKRCPEGSSLCPAHLKIKKNKETSYEVSCETTEDFSHPEKKQKQKQKKQKKQKNNIDTDKMITRDTKLQIDEMEPVAGKNFPDMIFNRTEHYENCVSSFYSDTNEANEVDEDLIL
jgi:hypothetical protein